MKSVSNLFLTNIDFCKPEVIQSLVLNFNLYLLIFWEVHRYFRVRIKYYKVIRKNCKACPGAPTMVQCDLQRYWNFYSPKSSKVVFWDVLCINEKSDLSKYQLIEAACSSVKKTFVHYI